MKILDRPTLTRAGLARAAPDLLQVPMGSTRLLVIVVLAVATSAAAGPNHERLTRVELEAASKAAVAALPKVDQAKVSQCKKLPTTTPAEQLALASCLHD